MSETLCNTHSGTNNENDTDRPDILGRLHHAQPLARGPYRRLVNDSITEIERLKTTIKTMEQQMKEIHWSDPVTITIDYEEALALAECTGFTKTFHIGGGHPLQKAALKALEEQYAYNPTD